MTVDIQKFPLESMKKVDANRKDPTLPQEVRDYFQELYEKYNLGEVLRERNS